MLLKSLKLKNIRSYSDQEIIFPSNSTVLSGDIGCGKSTILLAIEFALFGVTKPNLTGETLLRKGETSASVNLTFSINNQEITIERILKKEKSGIKQKAGFLIQNGERKDLTPVELKTNIIQKLGYPPELASKKNLVFRYTVYCPQELMKEILEDSPEDRLNTLRKIFNVDKYQKIRNNCITYLREVRRNILVLETRVERFDLVEKNITDMNQESEIFSKKIQVMQPKVEEVRKTLVVAKESLINLESQHNKHLKIKNSIEKNVALLKEKEKSMQLLQNKRQELEKSEESFTLTEKKDILQSTYSKIQQSLTEKVALDEKLKNIQQKIQELQQVVAKPLHEHMHQAQQLVLQLQETIKEKSIVEEKKRNAEKELRELQSHIHVHSLSIEKAKKVESTIHQLDNCPTCLQQVSETHKQTITEQEQKKQKESELLKQQFLEKSVKAELVVKETYLQLENINRHVQEHTKYQTELQVLQQEVKQQEEKKEQLKQYIQENNQLMSSPVAEKDIVELQKQRDELQQKLQQVIKQEEIQKQKNEIIQQINKNQNELKELLTLQEKERAELHKHPEMVEGIQKQKRHIEDLQVEDKDFTSELVGLQTSQRNTQSQLEKLQQELESLNKTKKLITKTKEQHHWLNNHFIPLMQTIEKQVMTKIHRLFNNIFQEWFSILIEDEVYANLDDAFTPVIQQQGHQILFQNLSGGERTSASLAYRLALNKVINDIIQDINTKDLLILDEPTDGFSSEQLDKVRDVLEKLNLKQILIVSHESKIESFVQNVIRIHKQEQVSCVM